MMKVVIVACLLVLPGCVVPEDGNSSTTDGDDGMQPRLALQIEPHSEMRETSDVRFSYNLTNVGNAATYVAPVGERSTIIQVEYPNGTVVQQRVEGPVDGSTGPWWWEDEDMIHLPPGDSLIGNYTEPGSYELEPDAEYVLEVLYRVVRTDSLNVTAYPEGVVARASIP